ncbi:hypothetical protein [Dickeya zeae]|uniref:hypothetical protein n=1 Tax=Dickeya zeae TaxID=204042 RepID=UPI0005772238|nr:hypothetical protein [Dickeya zeae]
MKISIEYRAPDAEGKRALRLAYYADCYLDPNHGTNAAERPWISSCTTSRVPHHSLLHNKETQRAAEAILAKRLFEYETGKNHLDCSNAHKASFFEYFQEVTDQKAAPTMDTASKSRKPT